ncbi:MAG: sulfotransferase [Phycisphaerales bacterium]|nr:sulfotransferase [Phycisphaerales bacterium]
MAKSKQAIHKIAHQAELAFREENFSRSLILYRKALKLDKNDAELLKRYGHILTLNGKSKEAVGYLERSCKRRPNHISTLMMLSFARLKIGELDGVLDALNRVLKIEPDHGAALLGKLTLYLDSGTPELAEGLLERALSVERPDPHVLIAQAKLARTTKNYAVGIDAATRVLEDPDTPKNLRVSGGFALGHLLDASGEYDRAFEAYRVANSARTAAAPSHAKSTITTWSKSLLDGIDPTAVQSERLVLVIGMPRSGTTLTEQIISAHPLADTVGEAPMILQLLTRTTPSALTTERLTEYGEEYLAYLDEQVPSECTRVVDKHMNADKSVGMLSKMYPNAKFIHCMRDPSDCCLSAYFQNFGHNLPFARDLKNIGEQYLSHREIMDHWDEVLDRPILKHVYEDLVDDPEPHVRDLLAHIDLEWDESCMRFHETKKFVRTASATQVRKPIYKSSKQRWRNYEKHLGPLFDALGGYAPK